MNENPKISEQRRALDVLVEIDRSKPKRIARQLEDQLRRLIRSGALSPGYRLPSMRALAADLSISRGAVASAYGQLAAEGYLELRQGAVPTVSAASVEGHPAAIASRRGPRWDLRPFASNVGAFPRRPWLRSLERALATATDAELAYVDPAGQEQLRGEVAAYLGRTRGVVPSANRTLITGGILHSVSLIARALARRGAATIAFENPSPQALHSAAERAGLKAIGIPVDGEGLIISALKVSAADAVFVTPAHQFLSGAVLSQRRREELVHWSRETGGLILEEDYNAEFRRGEMATTTLYRLAPECVAYLGSTWGTLAPALSLGWAVLPEEIMFASVEEIALSVGHLCPVEQLAMSYLMRSGEFDRHVRRMRAEYRRRRENLIAMFEERLPGRVQQASPAGLHTFLELESVEQEAHAQLSMARRGIAVDSVAQHALPGYHGAAGLLIGFGAVGVASLPQVVSEVALVLDERSTSAAAA